MLLHLWQLPQHLLAKFLIKIYNASYEEDYNGKSIYHIDKYWGISLGNYIIINKHSNDNTIKHEYGHSIQSLYFGPLYLFIIGLPSITMNVLSRVKILDPRNYYNRWPESWADQLGGVAR